MNRNNKVMAFNHCIQSKFKLVKIHLNYISPGNKIVEMRLERTNLGNCHSIMEDFSFLKTENQGTFF